MRKIFAGLIAAAFAAVMLLTSVPPVSASQPILTVSYTVSFTNTESCVTVSDQTTKCSFVSDQQWQGDWNGRMIYTGHWTLHGGKHVTVSASGFFEGSILGRTGTVKTNAVTIWWPAKEIDQMAIQSGTGELAGVHGSFDNIKGFLNPGGVIYMKIHFE